MKAGTFRLVLLAVVVLAVGMNFEFLADAGKTNLRGIQTARALVGTTTAPSPIEADTCAASWFAGLLENKNRDVQARDSDWARAISCSDKYVVLAHILARDDLALAEFSAESWPQNAEAWFWLGDLQSEFKAQYYQVGLELSPADGFRWLELGNILREVDPEAAIAAFLQACYYGDPGYHGCQGAGEVAEKLGDYESAIRYYRMSAWGGVRAQADRLEAADPE